MRNRSTWLVRVVSVSVCAALVIGAVVPSALAAPGGKPGKPTSGGSPSGGTGPGVPPGQPFQALQKQIDALDVRVDALEAAAPTAGLMWINPLGFVAVTGAPTIASVAGPGLGVTGVAGDAVQVGLQVPLGFAVTGARVCYAPVSATASASVQLLQDTNPPAASATVLGSSATSTGTAMVCVDTTLTSPVDPSTGGAMSLGLTFTAPDTIVIRSVGLNLTP